MVPDPVAMMEEDYSPPTDGPPRVAFEFLPAATCQPPEMARWQRVAAAVLLLLTLGSTFQLALGANIGLLPKVCVCVWWCVGVCRGWRRLQRRIGGGPHMHICRLAFRAIVGAGRR